MVSAAEEAGWAPVLVGHSREETNLLPLFIYLVILIHVHIYQGLNPGSSGL
jgi:hypothetical protein